MLDKTNPSIYLLQQHGCNSPKSSDLTSLPIFLDNEWSHRIYKKKEPKSILHKSFINHINSDKYSIKNMVLNLKHITSSDVLIIVVIIIVVVVNNNNNNEEDKNKSLINIYL